MTVASKSDQKPEWNQYFMFPIDMSDFHSQTSMVIEFYRDPPITNTSMNIVKQTKENSFFNHPNFPTSGRPINDLLAYTLIPLGDFTVLNTTDSGSIKIIENAKLNFIGRYSELPGVSNVFCIVEIKVPENWHDLVPIVPPPPKNFPNLSKKLNDELSDELTKKPTSESEKTVKYRKPTELLPEYEFDELINIVKRERRQQEIAQIEVKR
ncbi:hypothetical protein HK096_005548, partial [Nowakowskiella sp. JEL0078]